MSFLDTLRSPTCDHCQRELEAGPLGFRCICDGWWEAKAASAAIHLQKQIDAGWTGDDLLKVDDKGFLIKENL